MKSRSVHDGDRVCESRKANALLDGSVHDWFANHQRLTLEATDKFLAAQQHKMKEFQLALGKHFEKQREHVQAWQHDEKDVIITEAEPIIILRTLSEEKRTWWRNPWSMLRGLCCQKPTMHFRLRLRLRTRRSSLLSQACERNVQVPSATDFFFLGAKTSRSRSGQSGEMTMVEACQTMDAVPVENEALTPTGLFFLGNKEHRDEATQTAEVSVHWSDSGVPNAFDAILHQKSDTYTFVSEYTWRDAGRKSPLKIGGHRDSVGPKKRRLRNSYLNYLKMLDLPDRRRGHNRVTKAKHAALERSKTIQSQMVTRRCCRSQAV